MPPKCGDRIPEFEALLCDGEMFEDTELADIVGERGGVLVFYGFAFSATARHWWKRYARRGWDTYDGVSIVGVGRDGPFAQNEFLRKFALPFRIYADVDGTVSEEFDLLSRRDGMTGISTPHRSVFVVDDAFELQFRWIAENTVEPPPVDDVEAAVEDL